MQMKKYRIQYSIEALQHLDDIQTYIQDKAGSGVAESYTLRILAFCESLSTFPRRGTKHDDIIPGLRMVCYKKRVTIAFAVEEEDIVIIDIFYGGQDIEKILTDKFTRPQ